MLTTMVYSVIIQLASLLPKTFSTDIDLSLGRFNSLDRTKESLPHALLLLEDLLSLAPRQFAVVIDDILLCEDRLEEKLGTGKFLRRFVTIWGNGQVGRVLKVLDITDGWCKALWRAQEQICVMHEAARGPRRPDKGVMTGLSAPRMYE